MVVVEREWSEKHRQSTKLMENRRGEDGLLMLQLVMLKITTDKATMHSGRTSHSSTVTHLSTETFDNWLT